MRTTLAPSHLQTCYLTMTGTYGTAMHAADVVLGYPCLLTYPYMILI